jgi:hypothetical protein
MAEFAYQDVEAWKTTVRLAAAVGRLRIGSNLKAAENSQQHAFEQAGLACAAIAEGAGREGPAQAGLYRDARASLARCRAWLHVLAAVTNEQDAVFGNELDLAETAARQLGASLRQYDRGPGGAPAPRSGPTPAPGARTGNVIPGPRNPRPPSGPPRQGRER